MSATGAFYMKREILKGKKYLGWHIENGWKTHTNAQKIKIEAENKKKKDPCNPFRILGQNSLPLFVQHLKVRIYKHNMRPNFTGKIILELGTCKYPVRRCP